MSTTSQEAKSQLAEMRAVAERVRAAGRISFGIKLLGMIIGIGIVAVFIWASWIRRIQPLQDYEKWRPVVEQRGKLLYENIGIKDALSEEGGKVAKVYMTECQDLIEELGVADKVNSEIDALMKDLQPLLMSELERAQPKVEEILRAEADRILTELEQMIDDKVDERLAKVLAEQELAIQKEMGLSGDNLDRIVENLKVAGQTAAEKVIMKRIERSMDDIEKINQLLLELPELPRKMSQDALIEQLGLALLARAKFELPDPEEVLEPEESR